MVVVVKISVVVVGGSVVGFCEVGPAVVCGTVVVVDFSVVGVVDSVVGDGGGEVVVGIVVGEVVGSSDVVVAGWGWVVVGSSDVVVAG